jgi:two-component system chemotaxis response regulator CheB
VVALVHLDGASAGVTEQVRAVLKKLKGMGCAPGEISVKIVGGKGAAACEGPEVAVQSLSMFGIEVKGRALGGTEREVELSAETGELKCRKIAEAQGTQILEAAVVANSTAAPTEQVRVLVVDDSASVRKLLRRMIEKEPGFQVVGEATDAFEAVKLRQQFNPDVLTLDLHMPGKDGLTYLREFMPESPLPTIIVSDLSLKETGPVISALESGAFDYIKKPALSDAEEFASELNQKIRAAYVYRKSLVRGGPRPAVQPIKRSTEHLEGEAATSLVLIGASTGGVEALKEVLMRLPAEIPPILIVQHMPAGFTRSFAQRLNDLCAFNVKEAEHGDPIRSGTVYIAPGGRHMRISGNNSPQIELTDDPPVNRFKPSVDTLFESAKAVRSKRRVAVILTGMGNDGAKKLLELRESGVQTIGQDESTCVVYGMPRAAFELGAVEHVVALPRIADQIIRLLRS